jgi:AcrR family transcriptional regulator
MTNQDWLADQSANQEERMSEETRKRIIEAAVRVLARDGYAATSVKDIAAEAGVAPGLVHYYFKNKENLVVAAVAEGCAPPPWPKTDDPTEAARLALEATKQEVDDSTRRYRSLFTEMLGHASRSEPVRRTLLGAVEADRTRIEAATRAVIAERGGWSPERSPAIAAVVWAAAFGIHLQRELDPEFDAAAATDVLTELLLR